MEIQHAHGGEAGDAVFLQYVNNSTSVAIAVGDLLEAVFTSLITGVVKGCAWAKTTTTQTQAPKACALQAKAANASSDPNDMGLAQLYGYVAALKFDTGATAANRFLVPDSVAGQATISTATPTATENGRKFAYCVTSSGSPASVEAFMYGM